MIYKRNYFLELKSNKYNITIAICYFQNHRVTQLHNTNNLHIIHPQNSHSINNGTTLHKTLKPYNTRTINRHPNNRHRLRKSLNNFKTNKSNIVNLSNHKLTHTQQNVLNKGLKFIPTPKPHNNTNIQQSFQNYKRTMLIKYHYRHQPLHRQHPFHTKSNLDSYC